MTRRWLRFLWLLSLLAACTAQTGPVPPATATTIPTPSPPTATASSTATTVIPPTMTPAATAIPSPTVSPTPTLPPLCPLPPSLMLHSAFGAARTRALAEALLAQGLHTITYRDVLASLRRGTCPPSDAVLLSLDDLGTDWIRPEFKAIIQTLLERGLTLTVGVVAGREPASPAAWDYLRALNTRGVEIASHSLDHYNLPDLSDAEIVHQVQGSYQVLCEGIGRCPVTLILPFGNGADDPRVLAAAQPYTFLVGIQAPHVLIPPPPFVVGRIPPDNDSQNRTVQLLLHSFGKP